MRTLLLFDIDGTLILSGRAGLRALNRAFEDVTGVADAFHGINAAGRTDGYLLDEAARRAGFALTPEHRQALQARYFETLVEEIQLPGEGRKAVMPGVRPLLAALSGRDDVVLALLTGNFEQSARIKLEYFDLWTPFRFGAFADDASDRNRLVPIALGRAREAGCEPHADRVIVIGDTPLDIECAQAGGVRAVGVATGSHSRAELRDAGADDVLEDLSETDRVVEMLVGGSVWESNPSRPR
ncbi:MAG: haloacid dehalogenase-like hydrolase [Acidobacteriota bacterium]|nr:haloacid dehalogenase-like hydrolase [Acidobacteriota bacterium]